MNSEARKPGSSELGPSIAASVNEWTSTTQRSWFPAQPSELPLDRGRGRAADLDARFAGLAAGFEPEDFRTDLARVRRRAELSVGFAAGSDSAMRSFWEKSSIAFVATCVVS